MTAHVRLTFSDDGFCTEKLFGLGYIEPSV